MNKQNSPEKVVGQRFANAKREWHNLSKTHLASYAVGFQTPALVQPLTGNSTVVLDMDHAIQTNPTVTPVFDSMRVNVRAFFAPARLYCRGMIGNNFLELDEIENIELPVVDYAVQNEAWENEYKEAYRGNGDYFGFNVIAPGSLLNRLGYPASQLALQGPLPLERERRGRVISAVGNETVDRTPWNMMPIIAYYDICSRFLSNPYDTNIPFPTWENAYYDEDARYLGDVYYDLKDVQDWVAQCRGYMPSLNNEGTVVPLPSIGQLLTGNTSTGRSVFHGLQAFGLPLMYSLQVDDVGDVLYWPAGAAQRSSQIGLWPSLYMDDYATTYFDNEDIIDLMQVEVGEDMESFRIGKSVFSRKLRSILNGRRFDDWVEIHFGYKLKTSDHPIMVGADHFTIRFNDVFNQTADGSQPLGSSASRGDKGASARRRISFTTQEPGYLFVLIDIVPYVTYSNFLPNWLDWQKFGSFPLPEYSGRGFQDLTIGDVVNTGTSLNSAVVGKQPIYYDFMTNRDTLGGIFSTDLLDTYTFKRKFDVREIFGGGEVFDGVRSTYMSKLMYDYAFPDWGQNGGENIFIKSLFNLRVLQPIARQVIKTRL